MRSAKTPVKTGTLQERRRDEAAFLVERLAAKREAAITTLVKTEAKLIVARRTLARHEKRLQAATPAKPSKAVTPASVPKRPAARPAASAKVEPVAPPPAPKEAPAPASAVLDPAEKAAKLRDELRGERPRGRRRGPMEASAPSA
jgi:hypothetical protein